MSEVFENALSDEMRAYMQIKATYDPARLDGIDSSLAHIVTVDVKMYGATGDGTTDDSNAILTALSHIDKTKGGTLYFPPGVYKLNTKYLSVIGYNNLCIKGAGKGISVLDGTGILNYTQQGEWSNQIGVLKIEGADVNTYAQNITVQDLTIRKNTSYTSDRSQHNTVIRNVQNIQVKNVEFDGSYNEQVFLYGGQYDSAKHIRFLDCDFKNCVQLSTDTDYAQLNTNTIDCEDIIVRGCSFYNSSQAIMVLGINVNIQGNNFKNVSRNAIYVGESNGTARHSLGSCIVDGNTIERLGAGRGNNGPCQGIIVLGSTVLFADGSEDIGCIVSNNTILNTRYSHSANVVCIQTTGNAKINDNFIAGLQSEDASTNNCYAIQTLNNQNQKCNVYISNNVVNEMKASGELKFAYGIYLTHQKDSSYYLSDNVVRNATGALLLQSPTGGETSPLVSVTNDILNGTINAHGNWGDNSLNTDGSLNNLPMTGTNKALLKAMGHDINLYHLPANTANPSVNGVYQCVTANTSATTYTDFTNPIGYQKICLHINDSNTSIQQNGRISLSGGTNYTSIPIYTTIEFMFNPITNSWVEKFRHQGA